MTTDVRSRLWLLAAGYMVTQTIGTAVRLVLPDLVSERPRSSAELAAAVGADPDSVGRLVRALASLEIFVERDDVVAHTPMSELLCTNVAGSLSAQAVLFYGPMYEAWADSFETFRTGEPSFPRVHGSPLFDWLAQHPSESGLFNVSMVGGASVRRRQLLALDWSAVSKVVDVGGGSGATVVTLLLDNPGLTGIVYDLPHVRDDAMRTIEAAGLGDRCTFDGGSFFDSVPADADVYSLSAILHDWSDQAADAILQSVHSAMTPTSRLVLSEAVIAPGNERDNAKFLDLHMLVALGGRERSEDGWRELLSRNGFSVTHIESGLIEAVPV